MNPPPGMEEVYGHEDTIRELLPKLKGNQRLRDEAIHIMIHLPLVGSRLDALRRITKELKAACYTS